MGIVGRIIASVSIKQPRIVNVVIMAAIMPKGGRDSPNINLTAALEEWSPL
jgi:hypothetical protein